MSEPPLFGREEGSSDGSDPPPGVPPAGRGEDGEGAPDDEGGPIGIFPSWAWVYGTVLVVNALFVLLLYVFTVTLDFGVR